MFDKQIQALSADIDSFESGLEQWEVSMQQGMSRNNANILEFESDVNSSLHSMSTSLNDKFKITHSYDKKVVERMDMLRDSFNSKDLSRSENSVGYTVAQLEDDRHQKELQLTQGIVNFNNRVTKQIKNLEKDVMGEISALSVELSREEQRRADADKDLLLQVNTFLDGLKQDPQKTNASFHE